MTDVCFYTFYFYYLAFLKSHFKVFISNYSSELYLFAVASNVGFLKRFGGL